MGHILSFTTVNKRENNEDSCLTYSLKVEDKEYSILLLSDGMGGHDYGEIISNAVISNLSQAINDSILKKSILPQVNIKDDLDITKILASSLERTNYKILQLIKNNKWKGGGATVVAVIIQEDRYYWGILGDSRLYHINKSNETIKQQGFDHNVPGILLQQGAITPEIAKHHSQRNQLVYFMGIDKFPTSKNLEFIGEGKLEPNDILFLCSDGLTGKIEDSQILNSFLKYPELDLSELNRKLVIENQKLGEKDNQTSIVYVQINNYRTIIEEAEANEFQEIIQKEIEKEALDSLVEIKETPRWDIDKFSNKVRTIKKQEFENNEIKNLIIEIEKQLNKHKEALINASNKLENITNAVAIAPEEWTKQVKDLENQKVDLTSLNPILNKVKEKIQTAKETEKKAFDLLDTIIISTKFNTNDYRKWIAEFDLLKNKKFQNTEIKDKIIKVETKLELMKKKVEEKETIEINDKEEASKNKSENLSDGVDDTSSDEKEIKNKDESNSSNGLLTKLNPFKR